MSIQDDLLELAARDQRVIRAVVEQDQTHLKNALTDYETLRKSLRTRLLDQPTVSIVHVDAYETLLKICGGEGLATDKLIERLFSASEPDRRIDEFDDEELRSLGSDLFYSWFSHYEYITGLAELRPLVIRGSVGESVSQLVRQVKDCYAFQQYDAAYSLCRTVLEASARDICFRCRLFPDRNDNEILFEEIPWGQRQGQPLGLRDTVSSGLVRERLMRLYTKLCPVVHGHQKSVTRDEVRRAFEETLQVVEQLYARREL